MTWYHNGTEFYPPSTYTAGGSSGRVLTSYTRSSPIPNGTYRVEITYQGSVALSGTFTVGP